MKTLWMEVSDATGGPFHGYSIRPEGVYHRCIVCDATFPQTDEGFESLREHGFALHEQVKQYDWGELDGVDVTISVVQRVAPETVPRAGETQTELIAVAKDGTIYFLPFSYYDHDKNGGFKCRPKQRVKDLLRLTPPGVA